MQSIINKQLSLQENCRNNRDVGLRGTVSPHKDLCRLLLHISTPNYVV